jgi:shikimate kinase
MRGGVIPGLLRFTAERNILAKMSTPANCNDVRIALTGFMGVGKTSVARHLSHLLRCDRLDLDILIEQNEKRRIAEIIDEIGVEAYRAIETEALKTVLSRGDVRVLSLGGGTWTVERNRDLIRRRGLVSVWLDATFDHCWQNIRRSRKERPLARDKFQARRLFEERQEVYCLADWHFVVKPDQTSMDVARQIREEVFS